MAEAYISTVWRRCSYFLIVVVVVVIIIIIIKFTVYFMPNNCQAYSLSVSARLFLLNLLCYSYRRVVHIYEVKVDTVFKWKH